MKQQSEDTECDIGEHRVRAQGSSEQLGPLIVKCASSYQAVLTEDTHANRAHSVIHGQRVCKLPCLFCGDIRTICDQYSGSYTEAQLDLGIAAAVAQCPAKSSHGLRTLSRSEWSLAVEYVNVRQFGPPMYEVFHRSDILFQRFP